MLVKDAKAIQIQKGDFIQFTTATGMYDLGVVRFNRNGVVAYFGPSGTRRYVAVNQITNFQIDR